MMQISTSYGPSPSPTLLVLEESPFWSAELQRQLCSEPISIRLRCRVEDAWELLRIGQVTMLVIGSDIDLPDVLRLLAKLTETGHTPRITILLTPEKRDLEWSLRELGAIDILTTPIASRDLVTVVRRTFDLSRSSRSASVSYELKPSLSNH